MYKKDDALDLNFQELKPLEEDEIVVLEAGEERSLIAIIKDLIGFNDNCGCNNDCHNSGCH